MFRGTIVGNVVREPRMASTKTGIAVCNIDVATYSKRKDANGEKRTIYVKVTAWRALAETCAKYLHKGRKVIFYGTIEGEAYMGNDNQAHYNLLLDADDMEMIGSQHDAEPVAEENLAGGNQYRPEPKAPTEGFVAVDMSEDELPFDFVSERR